VSDAVDPILSDPLVGEPVPGGIRRLYDIPPPTCVLDHASVGQRVGAAMLELLLFGATLGIGWLLWWIVLWDHGKTPAKAVLKLRLVRMKDGSPASTWRVGAHEVLAKGLLPLVLVTIAIALVDHDRRGLWDHMTRTAVVRERAVEASSDRR
jgi:uncharacterized RDD family membrane protein YckC